jgi:GAF domain-containing protein
MLKRIQDFLKFTDIIDDEKRSELNLLQSILLLALLGAASGTIVEIIIAVSLNAVILGILSILIIVSIILLRIGNDIPARYLVPTSILIVMTYIIVRGNGIHDTSLMALMLVIILTSLTLGHGALISFGALTTLTIIVIGILEINKVLVNKFNSLTDFTDVFILVMYLILATGLQWLVTGRAHHSLEKAKENENKQIEANHKLQSLQTSLEERVSLRTQEIEEKTSRLERRTKELEAVSEISNILVPIRDLDRLLPLATQLISERFGFYHTGIFMLNDTGDYVDLKAASSEGGRRMIERQYRLRTEPDSLIGYVASRGIARIALNIASQLPQIPELSETRSEIALPLFVGPQMIGVLDVQSTQSAAFTEEEMSILTMLANLVAISIQNAHMFGETRQTLAEAEKVYQQFIQRGWQKIAAKTPNIGYKYSRKGVIPLDAPIEIPESETTFSSNNQVPVNKEEQLGMLVPIKLREQVIGVLNIKSADSMREWNSDELALIQAAADRAALALESARLLEDSQRRASKERLIGEISSKISAAANMENILITAVGELGTIIPETEISIQFQNVEDD